MHDQAAALWMHQVNASGLRDAAMKELGEKAYWEQFLADWEKFKEEGGVPGLKLRLAAGMEEVGKTWDRICEGGMRSDEGDLFEL
jgi:hypothetical protein